VQNAMDSVWAVPRNNRPDPIRSRVRSLALLIILGSAAITAPALSAVGRATETLGWFGKAGLAVAAVAINAAICLVAFRVTTARPVTYRQVLPGALTGAALVHLPPWIRAASIS